MSIITWVFAAIAVIYLLLSIFSREFREKTRWISVLSAIMFVIFSVMAVFVYLDISKLAKEFPKSQNLFAFDNNGEIAIAFTTKDFNSNDVMSGITILGQERVDDLNEQFSRKDYSSMLGANYKLIIVKRKSLEDNLPAALEFNKIYYTKKEIIDIISLSTGFDIFFEKFFTESKFPDIMPKDRIKERLLQELKFSDANDIRTYMFVFAFVTGVLGGSQGSSLSTITLLEQYQKGYITIYPETISFKMFKLVPFSTVKGIMQNMSPPEAKELEQQPSGSQ